jgi:hypothetical protein
VQAVLAQQWRPNVALYHDLSWIDPGALEIALVHGRRRRGTGRHALCSERARLSAPIESDDRVLSNLHGMTAAMWASSPPPPIMARPRGRELSL